MSYGASYRLDGSVVFRFPFEREVVDRIKASVPGRHRNYNPVTHEWTIQPSYASDVRKLMRHWFPNVNWERPASSQAWTPTAIRSLDGIYAELHLLPSAPAELVESAYRTLARLHHPDHGGTDAAMQRLNAAVTSLRDRRAAS